MKSTMIARWAALTVSVTAASAVWALPHYGDPNQGYDRIPGTRPSPHVAWAKPISGAKPKLLVLLPYDKSRNVVELSQRLDADVTWIMTAGVSTRTQAYREGGTATPLFDREADLVFAKIIKERLMDRSRKYDVIVIGKLSWELFEDEEKFELARRVREDGTGLVYFSPNRFARVERKTGGPARARREEAGEDRLYDELFGSCRHVPEVTEGVPLDMLPLIPLDSPDKFTRRYEGAARRAESEFFIGSSRIGKGRVVVVDYADPVARSPWHDAMAPVVAIPNGRFDWTVYDFSYMIAARAVLYAAGREDVFIGGVVIETPRRLPRLDWDRKKVVRNDWKNPPPRETVIPHPALTLARGDLAACKVSSPDGKPGDFTLRDRDRRAVCEVKNVSSMKLPALKRGDYYVQFTRRDAAGRVSAFSASAFRVESDIKVAAVDTSEPAYTAGEKIEGTFTLSRAPASGEKAVVTARDTWGRLVYRGVAKTAGCEGAFSVPVELPLGRLWDIFVTVHDDAGEVADATCWVGIPDWDFNDYYMMLIFCPRPGQSGWKGEIYPSLMQENGVNASYSEYIYSRPDYSEHDARHHMATWAYTDHHGELHNQPELVRLAVANTNLDIKALHEMMDAYIANGGKPLDEKKFPYRQHAMHVPLFNQQLDFYEYANRFGVMGMSVTGENYLSGEFGGGGAQGAENSGFAPKTTAAFQEWCRKEYKDDLAALNREWNTKFRDWKEVKGIMLRDAVEDDQLPRWVDFRFFMRSEMWTGFFLRLNDYIHTRCPKARPGFGGHANHDYTRYRGPVMTGGKLYVSQKENWEWLDAFECEMRQSMSRDDGTWLGSQSSIRWTCDVNNPISRRRIAWGMLLMGMKGFDLENGVHSESFGGMAWSTPDYSELLPYAGEVMEEGRRIQRGLGRLVFTGKPWRSPVAIYWSPRNHYISRLLVGRQPRGFSGSWLYNISLIDGAPNDALGMMNSLRIRPTVVGPQDIASGLAKQGFKAVWLPYNKGMSEEEAADIEAFVKAGGLVIADNEPGIYTQHGRKRGKRLLTDLFPDFTRLTVTKVGKGRAVYLAGALNCYPDRMLQGDFRGSDIVARILEEYVGVTAPVQMRDEKGDDVRDVRVGVYDHGETRIALFMRQHVGMAPNDSKRYTLDFGQAYDVYDVTADNRYLGRHAYLDIDIDHYVKCLALVPAAVRSAVLEASGPVARGGRAALALSVDFRKSAGSGDVSDAWHFRLYGPDGGECRGQRRNHVVTGGSYRFEFPVALDAVCGRYRAEMISAVSGVKAETFIEVK